MQAVKQINSLHTNYRHMHTKTLYTIRDAHSNILPSTVDISKEFDFYYSQLCTSDISKTMEEINEFSLKAPLSNLAPVLMNYGKWHINWWRTTGYFKTTLFSITWTTKVHHWISCSHLIKHGVMLIDTLIDTLPHFRASQTLWSVLCKKYLKTRLLNLRKPFFFSFLILWEDTEPAALTLGNLPWSFLFWNLPGETRAQ